MLDLKLIENNSAKVYAITIDRPLTNEEEQAVDILIKLKKAGFEAYWAGGAVRDLIAGNPAHDIDIATSARPEDIEKIFPKAYGRGRQFGVMAIIINDIEYEIATFRTDIGIADHRHPKKVEYTSAEHDAKRRDFTINGLFYDPLDKKIIDYVEGVEDLDSGILKFIGEPGDRIDEDYLRMIRAIRFVNRFGFKLDESATCAIKKNAKKIKGVSSERIRDELTKILTNKNRVESIRQMDSIGLLKEILPELLKMKGVEQPPEFHSEGDVWAHTLLALKQLKDGIKPEVAWTVLLHDIAKPETQGFRDHPKSKITFFEHDTLSAQKAKTILKRFKFPGEFIDAVSWAISQHMRMIHAFKNMSERKKEKLFLDPNIDILLEHTRADLLASVRIDGSIDLSMYENAVKLKEKYEDIPESEKQQVQNFSLITGKDIMQILGIEPGPRVGKVKSEIEQAYMDGKISKREEAIEMVKEIAK